MNFNFVVILEIDEIVSGIFVIFSLFNYSCDFSVIRNFYGDICVVRVIKNILSGYEIFDNYGIFFVVSVKFERDNKLKS